MSEHSSSYVLYRTSNHSYYADVSADGLDVYFPAEVRGWSDVLDCRIAPYTTRSLEENCIFAQQVRKYYILVTQEYVQTPL